MQKKRKRRSPHPSTCFVFTLETVQITQKALKLFEQQLRRATSRDEKMEFAVEEMERIKGKLDKMSVSTGHMLMMTFDYNERLILVAAIKMYIIDLNFLPLNAKREKERHYCRQIGEYFARDLLKEEHRKKKT